MQVRVLSPLYRSFKLDAVRRSAARALPGGGGKKFSAQLGAALHLCRGGYPDQAGVKRHLIQRNDECPCGSGRRYKVCHGG